MIAHDQQANQPLSVYDPREHSLWGWLQQRYRWVKHQTDQLTPQAEAGDDLAQAQIDDLWRWLDQMVQDFFDARENEPIPDWDDL